MISKKSNRHTLYIIDNDKDNERLRLLVILSPIFIASFDNEDERLGYLKRNIEKSKFSYALYPYFFEGFDLNDYRKTYENYEVSEDIYLNNDNKIYFYVNGLDEEYIDALKTIIEVIIIDDKNRKEFLNYFANIRNDIVINGRRSILANGIQGFYLSKYVVVRMLLICDFIYKNKNEKFIKIKPIYDLANNLKTPAINREK